MKSKRALKISDLTAILALEVITVVVVLMIFRLMPDRMLAARLASLSFACEGVAILFWLWPWRVNRWTLTAPLMFVFCAVFALPMALFRWFSESSFHELQWLGLNGPELHYYSTYFYYLLLAGTAIDLGISLFGKLTKKSKMAK